MILSQNLTPFSVLQLADIHNLQRNLDSYNKKDFYIVHGESLYYVSRLLSRISKTNKKTVPCLLFTFF